MVHQKSFSSANKNARKVEEKVIVLVELSCVKRDLKLRGLKLYRECEHGTEIMNRRHVMCTEKREL